MFPVLLWIITLVAVATYLLTWPSNKPWAVRFGFDTFVLLALAVVCFMIRPEVPSDPREAAEAMQWRPYLSAIYVAVPSILFLGMAGAVRHFIFRARA